MKTPGGHRRFEREDVEVFMAGYHRDHPELAQAAVEEREDGLFKELVTGASADHVLSVLVEQRQELGSWCAVAESLTVLLDELGEAWARGEITVVQEHIASERLIRAILRCLHPIGVAEDAPTALLLVVEEDEHTTGLHLVELCLREAGWNTVWVGPGTPVPYACHHILQHPMDLVAVSASSFSSDRTLLTDQADRLGIACQKRGVPMLLVGAGQWPERPRYGVRMRTFAQLRDYLTQFERSSGPH